VLRDFFFDACKCTHYVASNISQQGRPDNIEYKHYGMHNENNLGSGDRRLR